MRTITIIYDGSSYTYKWIKALLWAKKEFISEGYNVKYINTKAFIPIKDFASNQIDELLNILQIESLDIVLIAFHYSLSDIKSSSGLDKLECLKIIKESCNRLVWLDTADSTGNCQFEVMPFVDVYLKKQIYKDKSLYFKHLYGTKLFTDYYHSKYNIVDERINVKCELLKQEYANKLNLAWNIGLSDFWTKTRYCFFRPSSMYNPRFVNINNNRETLLFFNGTLNYSPLAGYQRKKIVELLESNELTNTPAPTAKMSHKEYVKYMCSSKAVISPFGWGEICYRDFEAFVYGATLIKPDMSQIETFPNFFVKGETYVALDWDFGNYDRILKEIGSSQYKDIAKRGQELYQYYYSSPTCKSMFVQHFLSVIS